MLNLVIDIGNSLTKIAIFDNRTLVEVQTLESVNIDSFRSFLAERQIDNAIISSVKEEIEELEILLQSSCSYFRFGVDLQLGINNQYKTPKTLGLDRLAAIVGAEALFSGKNSLIIDAGSCITYDFIDDQQNYMGGSISPGINMRFKSVHAFTHRLPLLEADVNFNDSHGTDTRSSILSGIQNGVYYEVLGFIQSYASRFLDLNVVLCGGDVKFFDTRLKSSIFADAVKTESNLVLIGLNEVIYQQNV